MTETATQPIVVEMDGRHRRRAANRDAVIQAVIELFEEGTAAPTVAEVADRAGISQRSVFRYFDDVDALMRAAIDEKFKEATPIGMLPAILPSTVVERVELLVDTRAELFEFLGATARMVRARQFDTPLIAETLARGRELLRRQVRFLFSAELDGEPDGVLAALDLLLSFESWDLLREDQGLDVAAARGVLTTGAVRLLGAG